MASGRTRGSGEADTKYFRQRSHVLGDIVNARVVYVTSPQYRYGTRATVLSVRTMRRRWDGLCWQPTTARAFGCEGPAATEALVGKLLPMLVHGFLDPS